MYRNRATVASLKQIGAVLLLAVSFLGGAEAALAKQQPSLIEEEVVIIIDEALKMQPLMWQGFGIPYSIERRSQHKDAAMLDILFNHQLLVREKETRVIEIKGSNRKRIALNYRYSFANQPDAGSTSSQLGFYYGYGRLKNILELSKPYLIGDAYYAEAYVQWYVADIQGWVDAPAFDHVRTLRRSLESKEKPFEMRIYLQYNGHEWAFWNGKPGGL